MNSNSSIEIHGERNGSREDRVILNQIRQAERNVNRGGRRGNIHSRNVMNIMQARNARINPNIDPDNSIYDR
jgi:hypothetical protein